MELKQNQKKETTIFQYINDWKIIFVIILEEFNNKSILEFNKKDWRRLSLFFKEKCDHSNARVNRLMSAMRSMLNYCEDDDDYEYNINTASKVKGLPKQTVREIAFLTNDQVFKILRVLVDREEYQKATLLMLAYDSGGRKMEIAQVCKKSFLNPNINHTNEVVGKRGKKFNLVYFSKTKEMAKLWLDQRGEDNIESLWVNIDKDGNKTEFAKDGDFLYNWIKYMNDILTSIMGENIEFNVHSFRHSCVENMSQSVKSHYALEEVGRPEGLTLEELQLMLNHSSSDVTKSYLKNKDEEMKLKMFGFMPSEEEK
jgi:integrase